MLSTQAAVAIFILSLVLSLITTLIYKFTTNQNVMKQLKDEIKELQKEANALKGNPSKALEVQKRMMATNSKYMMSSIKPMLITFLPIILIFGWMGSHFSYEAVKPGQDFTVSVIFAKGANGIITINAPDELKINGEKQKTLEDGKVSWILNSKKGGEYLLEFDYEGEKQNKNVVISSEKFKGPIEQIKKVKNSSIKEIKVEYRKLIIMPIGFKDWLGWLGTYIIFSIVFTSVLRKLLKVY